MAFVEHIVFDRLALSTHVKLMHQAAEHERILGEPGVECVPVGYFVSRESGSNEYQMPSIKGRILAKYKTRQNRADCRRYVRQAGAQTTDSDWRLARVSHSSLFILTARISQTK